MDNSQFLAKVSAVCTMRGDSNIAAVRATAAIMDMDPLGEREADLRVKLYAASYQVKGDSAWYATKEYEDPEEALDELNSLLDFDFPAEEPEEEPVKANKFGQVAGNPAFNRFIHQELRKTG